MNTPIEFKRIARSAKLKYNNQALPKIRTSLSPCNSAKHSPHSGSPSMKNCVRSNSTDRLPSLKNSSSGIKSIGSGKCSTRSCGVVRAYAVNSYPGKHHHHDRVSIIMNIQTPAAVSEDNWPKSSYFAIFDGHCGKGCAEYMKSNLSQLIFNDSNFPFRTKRAITAAFKNADQQFLEIAKDNADMSGTSAIIALIIGNKCFIAGTGDSRAIISLNDGKSVICLNEEHKPGNSKEHDRVIRAGGKVYSEYIISEKGENLNLKQLFVAPGKLKVSRALGDVDAKDLEYGGNPEVIICEPDVKSFKIKPDQSFILLASAPIYDKISNRELTDIVLKYTNSSQDLIASRLLSAIEEIFSECISRGCEENMTMIIISLKSKKKSQDSQKSK